jgi:hypothetical protein
VAIFSTPSRRGRAGNSVKVLLTVDVDHFRPRGAVHQPSPRLRGMSDVTLRVVPRYRLNVVVSVEIGTAEVTRWL